jgi:hypothetical protein
VVASLDKGLLGFAADAGWVAWAQAPCGSVVAIRNLASARTWTLKDHGADCWGADPYGFFGGFALGGRRAVWSTGWSGDFSYNSLEAAVAGGHAETVVPETTWTGGGDNNEVVTQAADEGIAVYSYVNVNTDNSTCVVCKVTGGVYSVVPHAKIRGLPPAFALAVGDGLIADIPLHYHPTTQVLYPIRNQPVYVYDTRTTRTVQATYAARAAAVSSSLLAVFEKSPQGHVIERFNPQTGAPLGSTPVPANTSALSLAGSGKWIVYSTGSHRIWLLDGATGKKTLIAAPKYAPMGLSIEGNHVYWAENPGQGRILMLKLP